MTRRLFVAAIALVAAGSTAVALAGGQGRGGRGPGRGGPPSLGALVLRQATDLGLTDVQVTTIEAIVAEEKSAADPLHEQLRSVGEQLRTLGTDGVFDEARVRTLAVQASQLQVELTVVRERAKAKVFAALTAEQRAQILERLNRMGPPPPGA